MTRSWNWPRSLEDKKTISGDEVSEIMGSVPGEQVMREPVGWQSVTEEVGAKRREQAWLAGWSGSTVTPSPTPATATPSLRTPTVTWPRMTPRPKRSTRSLEADPVDRVQPWAVATRRRPAQVSDKSNLTVVGERANLAGAVEVEPDQAAATLGQKVAPSPTVVSLDTCPTAAGRVASVAIPLAASTMRRPPVSVVTRKDSSSNHPSETVPSAAARASGLTIGSPSLPQRGSCSARAGHPLVLAGDQKAGPSGDGKLATGTPIP